MLRILLITLLFLSGCATIPNHKSDNTIPAISDSPKENYTSAIQSKLLGWSTICFFGVITSIGTAIALRGNTVAVGAAVSLGIGLLLSITFGMIVEYLPILFYITVGLALISLIAFVVTFWKQIKKRIELQIATKELVNTVETLKPHITNKQELFENVIPTIQSENTKKLISIERKKQNDSN